MIIRKNERLFPFSLASMETNYEYKVLDIALRCLLSVFNIQSKKVKNKQVTFEPSLFKNILINKVQFYLHSFDDSCLFHHICKSTDTI